MIGDAGLGLIDLAGVVDGGGKRGSGCLMAEHLAHRRQGGFITAVHSRPSTQGSCGGPTGRWRTVLEATRGAPMGGLVYYLLGDGRHEEHHSQRVSVLTESRG